MREALLAALGPRPVEQLLGVRPAVLGELVARGIPVRVYVPFGPNWFRYWMRRVAESRGADPQTRGVQRKRRRAITVPATPQAATIGRAGPI